MNLIAEIGINHNGSYKIAKELIKQSHDAGCWGVKFQYRNINRYLVNKNITNELGKEILDGELKINNLSIKEINLLFRYAKTMKLKVGISFFYEKDVDDFKKINFDFYKIPSPVNDNFKLIKKLKRKKKLLIISFGGKNLKQIKHIVNECRLENEKIVLMHCVSNYPLLEINSNIGFIDTLKKKFKKNLIGYSSHEKNNSGAILSLAKNISFIERHITLDKLSKGLDHSSSSNFEEIKQIATYASNFNKIFHNKYKADVNQGEVLNRQNLGISYFYKKDFIKGKVFNRRMIKSGYSNIGLTDLNLKSVLNKPLLTSVKKNFPVVFSDFKKIKISKKNLDFIKKNRFSLPIRPKDYIKISSIFPIKNFELHLSRDDVKNFNIKQFKKSFIKNHSFTIHLPDYCDNNEILDFFSDKIDIKKKSLDILNKILKISKQIKNINNQKINLIVSLSKLKCSLSNESYYRKVKKFILFVKKNHKIDLLPQWLPSNAWYFGGSVKINTFSNPDDLKFLEKIKLNLCMDISHFILSCNFYKKNPDKYYQKYKSIFKHYHFSDARGNDGEGILFGKGDLKNFRMTKKILFDKKKIKVLETWQGHLNNCYNFKLDIKNISKIVKN